MVSKAHFPSYKYEVYIRQMFLQTRVYNGSMVVRFQVDWHHRYILCSGHQHRNCALTSKLVFKNGTGLLI